MFMFTSAQMFTTTLSVYKALLQWAFIEIWILLIDFKYFQREKKVAQHWAEAVPTEVCDASASVCARTVKTHGFLMHASI